MVPSAFFRTTFLTTRTTFFFVGASPELSLLVALPSSVDVTSVGVAVDDEPPNKSSLTTEDDVVAAVV